MFSYFRWLKPPAIKTSPLRGFRYLRSYKRHPSGVCGVCALINVTPPGFVWMFGQSQKFQNGYEQPQKFQNVDATTKSQRGYEHHQKTREAMTITKKTEE